MTRLTISLDEEAEEIIDAKVGGGGEYESKSAFVRECVHEYERIEDLESELAVARDQSEQLKKRAERVEELETEIERLQNEKRQLIQDRTEKQELARYVEDERRVEQQWREAPMWTRVKWRVLGMPSETSSA